MTFHVRTLSDSQKSTTPHRRKRWESMDNDEENTPPKKLRLQERRNHKTANSCPNLHTVDAIKIPLKSRCGGCNESDIDDSENSSCGSSLSRGYSFSNPLKDSNTFTSESSSDDLSQVPSDSSSGLDSEPASATCDFRSSANSCTNPLFDNIPSNNEESYDMDTNDSFRIENDESFRIEHNDSYKMDTNDSFRIGKFNLSFDMEDDGSKTNDISFEEAEGAQSLNSSRNDSEGKFQFPRISRKQSQGGLSRFVQTKTTETCDISFEEIKEENNRVTTTNLTSSSITFKTYTSTMDTDNKENIVNDNSYRSHLNRFPRPAFILQNPTLEFSDENCISPGVLCSPTTFPLKYPTVCDPCFTDALNVITPQTMVSILKNKPKNLFIIDCRFPFEYNGGHIAGAENIYCPQEAEHLFFNTPQPKDTVIIFHCEYSQKRGPKMYRYVRELDRQKHVSSYPYVQYSEIYVLQGGYKAFYECEEAREFCEPNSYVPMVDKNYTTDLKLSWSVMNQRWNEAKPENNNLKLRPPRSKRSCRTNTHLF